MLKNIYIGIEIDPNNDMPRMPKMDLGGPIQFPILHELVKAPEPPMKRIRTAEYVSPKHPDKMCDQIADAILDAYLAQDPMSRVAIEVMGGHGVINVSGEVTSKGKVLRGDISKIVQRITGINLRVRTAISEQSPEIARGVDTGGAGDQGICVGYATAETKTMLPQEYYIARNLCDHIYQHNRRDGKTQVTMKGEMITDVVSSFQGIKKENLEILTRQMVGPGPKLHINPAGDWNSGGFDSDSGLSGRKIVVDSYGPNVPVGGGSFSGKDPTKVDRSGAYMARHIACDWVRRGAKESVVYLAYAIGVAEPVMAVAVVDGHQQKIDKAFDLTPNGIIERFQLRKIKYEPLAAIGHFGRGLPWDQFYTK